MASPGTVAILTRDRPEELRRSLRSHAEQARRYGHEARLLLLDDSPAAEMQAHNRAALREAVEWWPGFRAQYYGLAEKCALAQALARQAQLPLELVEFAFFGWQGERLGVAGGNLNAFLLLTVGERALCFDDDIVCRVAAAPGRQDGWALSSRMDPTQVAFYEDRESARAAGAWVEEDVYTQMCAPVGRTVAELTRGAAVDAREVQGPWAEELQRGEGSAQVLISMLGVRGDSGMGSSAYLLKARGKNHARLVAGGPERLARVLQNRQLGRSVTRPTLCESSYFQSYGFGVDGAYPLPPCVPVFRSYDTKLPGMVRMCWPRPLICYLPLQVWHEPPGHRQVDLERFTAVAGRTSLGHWFHALLLMFRQSPEGRARGVEPMAKVAALGALMQDFARLPLPQASEAMQQWVRLYHEQEIAEIDGLLQEYGAGAEYWAVHLRRYRAALAETLQDPLGVVPVTDPPMHLPPKETMERVLGLVRKFGELLQAWPALVRAARGLRQ